MVRYIIIIALLAGIAALLLLLAARNRRLRRLSEAMEDYLTGHGGKLELSLKEDEVARVENAALEMQNRIEITEERFREETRRTSDLTADISHQLKTPLASLRLFCEMDRSANHEQQISQIERMESLISSLLHLEKLCADGYAFVFSDADVRALAEQEWAQLQPLWPGKTLTVEGEAVIRCDPRWFAEALHNLMKNACEHTPEDGQIRFRMERTEHAFYCSLEDNGGGVPEKDLARLFERFYRAEGAKQQGCGLGLAIVKEIVYRHHGHIAAENTASGLKFTISLPQPDMVRSGV